MGQLTTQLCIVCRSNAAAEMCFSSGLHILPLFRRLHIYLHKIVCHLVAYRHITAQLNYSNCIIVVYCLYVPIWKIRTFQSYACNLMLGLKRGGCAGSLSEGHPDNA